MLDYSIIIPAYNEALYLSNTLDSLGLCSSALSKARGEVIVVDNNSTDSTSEIAKKSGARVVFQPKRGISLARNAGAREARGKVFFFVDADTQVPAKAFIQAYDLMKCKKALGGGSIIKFDQSHGRIFFGVLIPHFWNSLSYAFKLAAGSFIFCDRKSFLESGGFAEDLYAGEEIFFSRKMKRICRKNKKRFQILTEFPVITSSRKLLWYNNFQILAAVFQIIVFPFSLKSRRQCKFWYKRPD
ncbi:MAG: glycosyl transferase family 2 [Opitutae bacterium]|nr:glycosyl transferase family 2 [Opitutae bacterium]|tara:strand:+ start:3985 stop:4713 length:729 start_codon:yes stop_codon:yes gene_type:complete